jgi:hypothetical protein
MDIPKKLYKYCKVDKYTKEIFLEQALFASSRDKFNDPFDCRIKLSTECTLDEFREAVNTDHLGLQRFIAPDKDREAQIKSLYERKHLFFNGRAEENLQQFVSETGILCFSELNDHILMWSHYADYHRGICLIFDTEAGESLFKIERDSQYNTRKISYCNTLPVFECFNTELTEVAARAIFRKSPIWEYEKEWRIIKCRGANEKIDLPRRTLVGVILGSKISLEDRANVEELCRKVDPALKIYKSSLKEDVYGLEITGY